METCIVTGGAGFIGSNFIKYLLKHRADIRIVNIDKLTYSGDLRNLEHIEDNGKNYFFINGDITDRDRLCRIFREFNPDYVLNFAAESHVDRSIEDSEVFIKTNVLGTQVLLNAARNIKLKKYIQISTDEVYGSYEDGDYFTEESPLKPSNPYAASKAGADILTMSFHTTYGLPVIITRCTNNYGPNQHEEKFIPLIIKQCLTGKRIPVYGDGRNIRDWLYVQDHCAAIHKVLAAGRPGQIYNISAYSGKENIDVIKLIINNLRAMLEPGDPRRDRINESLVQYVADRKSHDKRYAISSEKLRNELGWSPMKSFEEGLAQTLKWYIDLYSNNLYV